VTVHGFLTLAFGLMTVGAPALSLYVAVPIVIGWLLLHAGVAIGAAMISKLSWRLRAITCVWGGINVIIAVVAALYPEGTIFALLVFGAAYAALFGVWQMAVGLWLRHELRSWGPPEPHVVDDLPAPFTPDADVPHPISHVRRDVDIAHDAVNALISDADVPDKTIKVRVQDAWIWLLGHAESPHQREAAERAVRNVSGVKGVTDLVRLERARG